MDNNKKPGRKKKVVEESNNTATTPENIDPPVYKKRGRKPKGGKIIVTTAKNIIQEPQKQNIILHLKCKCSDINNIYNINYIQSQNNCNNVLPFNNTDSEELKIPDYKEKNISENYNETQDNHNINTELWKKIKSLSSSLHSNIVPNKKSNCFWCTCEFDGPSVFIPKHKSLDKFYVYGVFCSPECAAAFIFNENIDTSQKFERYYLLNNVYSSIYKYTTNIKPAPSPLYTLNKFMGNLTIQEYRSLSKNNQLITTIDKPMTRTFPEIFEDNDEYNIKNIPNENVSNYNLCRKNTNKSKYFTENFSI